MIEKHVNLGNIISFANKNLFIPFQFYDTLMANKHFSMVKWFLILASTAYASNFIFEKYSQINNILGKIESKDEDFRRDSVTPVARKIVNEQVWPNEGIKNSLNTALVKYVMESDKIRFLLAKALGQALNLDQTKRAISGVTKEQLLKKNVLYTDQVYD